MTDAQPVRGTGEHQSREAPLLETERLRLRPFSTSDFEALAQMWAKDEVVRFIGGKQFSREDTWRRTLAACGQWPYVGYGYWIADLKEDGRLVGQLGFADFKRDMTPNIEGEPELGYVFDPSVHGQGIALEACRAALAWAEEAIGAPSYPAIIDPQNIASMRLAEKLGFERQEDATYRGERLAFYRRPAKIAG